VTQIVTDVAAMDIVIEITRPACGRGAPTLAPGRSAD
jgi:hypothetical protein